MRVTLAKRGGQLAGMYLNRPPGVVDAAALPKGASEELIKLVSAAKAAPPAKEERPGRGGDTMSYKITVEEGGPPIVLAQSDTTMSREFAALLQWLEKHLARK